MNDKGRLILVVEDNSENSELAEKILKHSGFRVHISPDGDKALEYCKNNSPDLILMDISLPTIDGLEVTRQLRGRDSFKTVPIIALTAHVIVGFEEQTREAGCSDYLSKPFMPNDLVGMVNKHL
ncbi:MAG: CheY-like chemotaxis protein [Chlamydiales bacterium]|jgi:CheY-like chemotaxis protein